MSDVSIEKLLPRSNFSIYRLVRMASNRAKELSEGRPRLIEKVSSDKVTTIALEEIMHGKIEYDPKAKTVLMAAPIVVPADPAGEEGVINPEELIEPVEVKE